MSKHTEGPWLRDGRTVYALNEDGFNRFSAGVQDPHTPEAELIAVATLMQSAPDMQEALINTLALASLEWGYLDKHANVVFEQARAALAKSRGQS